MTSMSSQIDECTGRRTGPHNMNGSALSRTPGRRVAWKRHFSACVPRALVCGVALSLPGINFAADPVEASSPEVSQVAVGYRVIAHRFGDGTLRDVHVWYPTAAAEQALNYGGARGQLGLAARDATPRAGRAALLLFSHGYLGAGDQSLFLTENLARAGYVVVAPNHRDSPGSGSNMRRERPEFENPRTWDARKFEDRRADLIGMLDALCFAGDPGGEPWRVLRSSVDCSRVGAIGHSLGGYAALGLGGARREWFDSRVRAVVALSPYAAPYLESSQTSRLQVPVMLQGATLDVFITPSLGRLYRKLDGPKCELVLRGESHFAWTNLASVGRSTTAAVGAGNPRWIAGYTLAFLDQHLRDVGRRDFLARPNRSLARLRCEF